MLCHWLSPRPGHTRALVQRTSTVDATHTLRGSGPFWRSLRPEHHPSRGAAEGSCTVTYRVRAMLVPGIIPCTLPVSIYSSTGVSYAPRYARSSPVHAYWLLTHYQANRLLSSIFPVHDMILLYKCRIIRMSSTHL